MMRMHPQATDPDAPINAGVRHDMRLGLASGRFATPSEAGAMIVVVGVVQAGLSRTLDLLDPSAVAHLGHDVGLVLLRGLGVAPRDAATVMRAACAAVFDHAVPMSA